MPIYSTLKKLVAPVATTMAALVHPPCPGCASVLDHLKEGNYVAAGHHLVFGMTGMNLGVSAYANGFGPGTTEFDIGKTLNPIDFERAPIPKVYLWSTLSMEAISKIGSFIRSIFNEMT